MVITDEDSSSSDVQDLVHQFTQIANTIVDIEFGPSDPISSRNYINKNREMAHDRLIHDYFGVNPLYNEEIFATRFRIRKQVFQRIVNDFSTTYEYFTFHTNGRGRQSFTALQKCTSVIRQLAYGIVSDKVNEYLQMSARTSCESLQEFCKSIIDLYKRKYLRRPTVNGVQNLYRLHETQHGFRDMLGSLDFAGSNNDINVLRQSPLFNDVINEVAPSCLFEVNGVTYNLGYYLGYGIYPPWSIIFKSFSFSADEKRKRFKVAQEAGRKDVERLFGVMKSEFWILQNPARAMTKEKITRIIYACYILHNIIFKDEGSAVCPFHENELPSQDELREKKHEILTQVYNRQLHFSLQADLVEHIHHVYVPRIERREENEDEE